MHELHSVSLFRLRKLNARSITKFRGSILLFVALFCFIGWHHSVLAKKTTNFAVDTNRPCDGNMSDFEQILAASIEKSDSFSRMLPIVIKGSEWPTGIGDPLEEFTLFAVKGDRLIPIPFQIDEYDETGLVYVPGVTTYAPAGRNGYLDRTDELIFMYRDAGVTRFDRQKHTMPRDGKLWFELEIKLPQQEVRYVYIVRGSTCRSSADYVSIKEKEVKLQSTHYEISTDPKNLFNIHSVHAKWDDHVSKNIWDNLYVKLESGFMHQNFRAALDTANNIEATIVGVVDGPVRATALVELTIRVANLPLLSMQLNLALYEQAMKFRSRFSGNSFAVAKYVSLVLRDPQFRLFLDFANLNGATFGVDTLDLKNGLPVVDGHMSQTEVLMNTLHLPGRWVWLDSGQGWGFYLSNVLPFEKDGLFIHFAQGVEWQLYYRDDLKSLEYQERFPGAGPRFGVIGSGLPPVILELISALAALDFSELETIDDLIDGMANLEKHGKLDELNRIISRELKVLKRNGRVVSNHELVSAFIKDLDRVGLKGLDRKQLNELVISTALTIPDFTQFNAAEILLQFRAEAKKADVDLQSLQYAPRDNTLWMPLYDKRMDPDAFYLKTEQNPRFNTRIMH